MKCEICGKEHENLEECEVCGKLYCPECGAAFLCDKCFDEKQENENRYHGCFF